MEKKSGFLDGYMAGNLEANAPDLKMNAEKIEGLLGSISSELINRSAGSTDANEFSKSFKDFTTLKKTASPSPEDYVKYSSELKDLISSLKSTIDNSFGDKVPTEILLLLKRTIYNFLIMAKTLQDSRIVDNATSAASLFKDI